MEGWAAIQILCLNIGEGLGLGGTVGLASCLLYGQLC